MFELPEDDWQIAGQRPELQPRLAVINAQFPQLRQLGQFAGQRTTEVVARQVNLSNLFGSTL